MVTLWHWLEGKRAIYWKCWRYQTWKCVSKWHIQNNVHISFQGDVDIILEYVILSSFFYFFVRIWWVNHMVVWQSLWVHHQTQRTVRRSAKCVVTWECPASCVSLLLTRVQMKPWRFWQSMKVGLIARNAGINKMFRRSSWVAMLLATP